MMTFTSAAESCNVNRTDAGFVRASLLEVGPGTSLYSAAGLVLLLAVIELFVPSFWLQALFLTLQMTLGAFLVYLVFCSSLPATTWNWLLIPFNPVTPLLWKWRSSIFRHSCGDN